MPGQEDIGYPFFAFSFAVEISVPSISNGPLCSGAFAECDGLEVSFDVKTIREGGNNDSQIRLAGPRVFGTLTLKRGMTNTFDLWTWVDATTTDPSLRGDARVVLLSSVARGTGARSELARFELSRCLPQKLKAPALNAKDGVIAIEELQLAYETLKFVSPSAGGGTAGSS
ncbi:MAG TPA: phage tail protein [Polyangiaceae bacterium]|jgi:phage tail-like protein